MCLNSVRERRVTWEHQLLRHTGFQSDSPDHGTNEGSARGSFARTRRTRKQGGECAGAQCRWSIWSDLAHRGRAHAGDRHSRSARRAFALTALVLLLVGTVAKWIPAAGALRIDPAATLRSD